MSNCRGWGYLTKKLILKWSLGFSFTGAHEVVQTGISGLYLTACVMVQFLCPPDWVTGGSDIWSNILLGVSVCFWMRLIFELGDWEKHIVLPNAWPSSNQLNRTKKLTFPWRRDKFLVPDCWAGTLLFSWLSTWIETLGLLRSQACWLLDWSLYPRLSCFSGLWIWPGLLPLVLLSLQLANCRSYDFSASIITWVNSL